MVYNYRHAWSEDSAVDRTVFESLKLGERAPEIRGMVLDGGEYTSRDKRGKYVVVEFGSIT